VTDSDLRVVISSW